MGWGWGVIRAKELRLYVVALCLFFWSGMWELRMSLWFSVFRNLTSSWRVLELRNYILNALQFRFSQKPVYQLIKRERERERERQRQRQRQRQTDTELDKARERNR